MKNCTGPVGIAAEAGESAFGYIMALFDIWKKLVTFILEERKCIYLQ